MTSVVAPLVTKPALPEPQHKVTFGQGICDTAGITVRNLRGIIRTPRLMAFSSIQPVMFVLLFRYVFAGAIKVPTGNYVTT